MNTKELIIKIINPEWEHAQFVSIADLKECEKKLEAANERIKRLEEALDLVLKMRNDWLENQEDGYEGAYYAFVKGNDSEWEEIIKAKEDKL